MPDNFDIILAENAMLHMTVTALKGQVAKLNTSNAVLLGVLKLILLLQSNYKISIPGQLVTDHVLHLDDYEVDVKPGTLPNDLIYRLVLSRSGTELA